MAKTKQAQIETLERELHRSKVFELGVRYLAYATPAQLDDLVAMMREYIARTKK